MANKRVMAWNCTATIIDKSDHVEYWNSREISYSSQGAINAMKHNIHEKYGYKVYIRDIHAEVA